MAEGPANRLKKAGNFNHPFGRPDGMRRPPWLNQPQIFSNRLPGWGPDNDTTPTGNPILGRPPGWALFGITPRQGLIRPAGSAIQAHKIEFLHTAVAAIAGIEIALGIGGQDVQAQKHAGILADMTECGLRNFRQCLPV